jgi:drug/metabolite transporter (DMT)-like permease
MLLSPRLGGLVFAIAAPLAWSCGGTVMRSVEASPWDIVFWRASAHLIFFPIVIAIFWGRSVLREARAVGWPALVVASTMCGTYVLHVLGMTGTTVANALILQSMTPLYVAVLGWWLLGERLSIGGWLVIALAFGGLAIVVAGSLGGGHMSGNIFASLVACCSATHVLILRHYRSRNLAAVTLLAAGAAAIIAFPLADPFHNTPRDIISLILLGGVQMSFGVTCFMMALRRLPAAEVTLIALLEPILGPFWVWLIIGEQPATTTLIGGAVVIVALAVHVLLTTRRLRQESSA